MTTTRQQRNALAQWLFLIAAMIYIMILLGGLTRLTEAGLSIVRWDVVQGSLPPLSQAKWLAEFEAYKLSPQYLKVNQGMSLEAFKFIYLMEWFHRFWGRLIGLVFFFPLLYFWLKGYIQGPWKGKLAMLFVLGGMQGVVGWFMVKSGLVDLPRVSHYRLTLHLYMALLVLGLSLWHGLQLREEEDRARTWPGLAKASLLFLVLQIGSGGFVAGIRAGYSYNTWPKMGEDWMPDAVWAIRPWYLNFLENPVMIQWVHRYLAYIAAAIILCFALQGWQKAKSDPRAKIPYLVLMLLLGLQIGLGISTLVLRMPLALASAHQAVAFALFSALVVALHRNCKQSQEL